MTQDEDRAKDQAGAQLSSIKDLVNALEAAKDNDEDSDAVEKAEQAINEDPLSIEVRGGWHTPFSAESAAVEEYKILLCTGGPAVRLIGELDEYGQPSSASLEYQDWGTPWTRFNDLSVEDESDLLTYAQQFYYSE